MTDPERIDRLIEHQRRRWGRSAPAGAERAAELADAWRRAVGAQIAAHAVPARMTGETLVVACESATWAGELTLLRRTVLAQLRSALGAAAPAELRFVVGELPASPEDAQPRRREALPRAPSPGDERAARALAERLSDPELRVALERALAAALARQGDGGGPAPGGDDGPL